MRIIAGKFKGKRLVASKIDKPRPTLDRIKENIFNIIQFMCKDATVLDLFAGTGALGLEAESRGAKNVYLCDNDFSSIKLIKTNCAALKSDAHVGQADFLVSLKNFEQNGVKFDIIFLDPPYQTDLGAKAIKSILSMDLLNSGGVIVYEAARNDDCTINLADGYSTDIRQYGTVQILFIYKK